MFVQLRFRDERTAGVVEVDLAAFVQPAIFRCAQIVQQSRLFIARETRDEIRVRFFDLEFFLRAAFHHIAHFIPSKADLRRWTVNPFPSLKVVSSRQSRCSLSGVGKGAGGQPLLAVRLHPAEIARDGQEWLSYKMPCRGAKR